MESGRRRNWAGGSCAVIRKTHVLGWALNSKMGADMAEPEDDRISGRIHGEQFEAEEDSIWMRLIFMIIIWMMLSFALTVLGVVTVIQFIILLIQKEPNPRLADFGTDLGIWMAKASRYQLAASNVKPWPWTELD